MPDVNFFLLNAGPSFFLCCLSILMHVYIKNICCSSQYCIIHYQLLKLKQKKSHLHYHLPPLSLLHKQLCHSGGIHPSCQISVQTWRHLDCWQVGVLLAYVKNILYKLVNKTEKVVCNIKNYIYLKNVLCIIKYLIIKCLYLLHRFNTQSFACVHA